MLSICFQIRGQERFTPNVYIEAGTGANFAIFDVGAGSPGLSIQGGVLYDLSRSWRLGANFGIHRTSGSDEGSLASSRGYEFRSNLNEISAKGVYIFRFRPYPAKKWKIKLEPRAWASLGFLQFQPKPNELLSAENNGDYLTVAALFSGGMGIAYDLARDLSLVLEAGGNITTSDYLDGYADNEGFSVPDLFPSVLLKVIFKVPRVWS